jgi:predicted TIM-barrel fold metal-dependent hydrolase
LRNMADKIVDVHVHPLTLITEEHLLRELDNAEVDMCVLLALDVDSKDLNRPEIEEMASNRLLDMYFWDAKKVVEGLKSFLDAARIDNGQVADLVKKHPNRFVGFGSINLSRNQKYVEEKIKEIDRLGLKGVKLIPTLQFFNPVKADQNMQRLFEYCEKEEKIITYHTGCDPYVWEEPHFSQDANPEYLKSIIESYESVQVILAHMGCYSSKSPGIWLDEALELGKENENVWYDIAAVPYVVTREKFVDKIRSTVGLDRVLFGSDYPAVNGVSIESMIDEVKSSDYLSREEKENILGLNAMRLLGLQ